MLFVDPPWTGVVFEDVVVGPVELLKGPVVTGEGNVNDEHEAVEVILLGDGVVTVVTVVGPTVEVVVVGPTVAVTTGADVTGVVVLVVLTVTFPKSVERKPPYRILRIVSIRVILAQFRKLPLQLPLQYLLLVVELGSN